MIRRPPKSTRTETLFPSTTLFRSLCAAISVREVGGVGLAILPAGLEDRVEALGLLLDDAVLCVRCGLVGLSERSEEHTSELQSLMRISYAVFCLKKNKSDIRQSIHVSRQRTKENQRYYMTSKSD